MIWEKLCRFPMYFYTACALPAIMIYLQATATYSPTFKGQNLSIWAAIVGGGAILLLWLIYRRIGSLETQSAWLVAIILIAWTYQVLRIQFDGSVFNVSAFLVPLVLILILGKPPTSQDAASGLLIAGYSLLIISLVSLMFGSFSWAPDGFAVSDAAPNRIPFLSEIFGINTRWGGPFGSVNFAAPIGGLLVVIGLGHHRWNRWILISAGLLILGLGQSRTALIAVLVSVVVYTLWSNRIAQSKFSTLIKSAGMAALGLLGLTYIIYFDPSLNGRTTIWSNFLGLLPGRLFFGTGDSGVNSFVNLNTGTPGFIPHIHAHSVVLDGLVRFGIVMLCLSLLIFTFALVITYRAVPRVGAFPFALVVYTFVAGLTETIYSWSYWSVYIVAILGAALMSQRRPKKRSNSL